MNAQDLVNKCLLDPDTGCWEWQRGISCGYGRLWVGGKTWQAHRLMWTLVNGHIPDGHFVCHTCDRPLCINPEHLFVGTQRDNMKDASQKARCRTRPSPGELNPGAKLTADQVLEIRAARNTTPNSLLAKKYGVRRTTITNITNRTTWSHI